MINSFPHHQLLKARDVTLNFSNVSKALARPNSKIKGKGPTYQLAA